MTEAYRRGGFREALGDALQRPGGAHAELLVQRAPHRAGSCGHHSFKVLQADAAALQQTWSMMRSLYKSRPMLDSSSSGLHTLLAAAASTP